MLFKKSYKLALLQVDISDFRFLECFKGYFIS